MLIGPVLHRRQSSSTCLNDYRNFHLRLPKFNLQLPNRLAKRPWSSTLGTARQALSLSQQKMLRRTLWFFTIERPSSRKERSFQPS
jgi:hypothetical protein